MRNKINYRSQWNPYIENLKYGALLSDYKNTLDLTRDYLFYKDILSRDVHFYGSFQAITEELGEVAQEVKRIKKGEDRSFQLRQEIGDLLFNILLLAGDHGISISDILTVNLIKMKDRLQEAGA